VASHRSVAAAASTVVRHTLASGFMSILCESVGIGARAARR